MTSSLEVGIMGWAEGRNWGSWGHCAPLEVGSKRKERPHQASCYRGGGESGGIGSQNQWRAVGPPSPYPVAMEGASLGYQGRDAEVGVMSKTTSLGRRVRR